MNDTIQAVAPGTLGTMELYRRTRAWVYSFGQQLQTSMGSSSVNFAMLSHTGRVRKGNEDTCAASAGAFVVCDGMGGAAAGEVASAMAAKVFLGALTPRAGETPRTATPDVRLDAAIQDANEAVYARSRTSPDLHGMGTTLVALLLCSLETGRPSLTLAHVGDSRAYLFRTGALAQLTQDHSLVEEQVRAGELTPAEAEVHPLRNIITRAVGSQPSVEPDLQHLAPLPGDVYLPASDGLTRELPDAAIAATLRRAVSHSMGRKLNLNNLCQTLVDQANDAGGNDNITVLLLQIP